MSACKPHDCASERLTVLSDPRNKTMYGARSVVDPQDDTGRPTWLTARRLQFRPCHRGATWLAQGGFVRDCFTGHELLFA
ncbi:Ivy family c-type lysozyme inhibitor [Burkholderia sp. F1]|uniref:Ivy family c-type lysozyme inhibitor n=1 Tax=Burkholderia sp. F1 TaxID=3366817 RepID=UPI003D74701E